MKKDKRKTRRRAIRRSAWLALAPGELHGCMLSDISDAGVRIEVEDAEPIPDHFVLFLSNNGAARRACRVVWRNARQLGVKFETQLADAEQATPVMKPDADHAPSEHEPAESA
jgi:hypothetical protein